MLMVVIVMVPAMMFLVLIIAIVAAIIVAIVAVISAHVAWLVFRWAHEVNRPAAGVVLVAIPAPVPHMTRGNV
jgi:hypothetical protein